jgi:hypothetical protein
MGNMRFTHVSDGKNAAQKKLRSLARRHPDRGLPQPAIILGA